MSDQSEPNQPKRGMRLIAAGGAVTVALVIGGAVLARDGTPLPATTTTLEIQPTVSVTTVTTVTTVPPPPTSPPTLQTLPSPFDDVAILSRSSSVPDNPPASDAAAEFYVDPGAGDDANPGTATAPVATLEAAQRLARPALREAAGDVVVYLKGGVHMRAETFRLGFQDSGRDNGRMIYRSYPGEQAVLEGGVRLDRWEPAFGSVLVADVPSSVPDVRQFFAAGDRQPRARSAEASGVARRFVKGPLFNAERYVAMTVDADLVSGFSHADDLELVYVGVAISGHGIVRGDGTEILRPSWKAHRLPVSAVSDLGNGVTRLDIGNGALHHAAERGHEPMEILPSDPFFFENAIELLDQPGEWFFDQRERRLYWWPPQPDATADAWVAVTEVMIAIDGTLRRPVRNVTFDGIALRHAGYARPNDEGYVVSQAANWFTAYKIFEWMTDGAVDHSFLDRGRPPGFPGAAVEIDSARAIEFTGNVFAELGGAGVLVSNDVRNVTFDRNLFVDISAEAFIAGHPEHDEIDEPTEAPVGDIAFTNNVVDEAGAEFYASVGLQVTKADRVEVSHNLFRNLPYSGVSLGWGWANNLASSTQRAIKLENNYFENVVNLLYDGAPIYLLGPVAEIGAPKGEHTHIRGNFANNLGADDQFKAPTDSVPTDFAKRPGIQLDQGVRNVVIADNVFSGATDWLQLTAWQDNRNVAGWIGNLGITGNGNWSDTAESVPDNTTLIGVAEIKVYGDGPLPAPVLRIIEKAGLEPGIELPPLP